MGATDAAILIGAGLVTVSVLTSVLSFRMGAPLLLIFLGIGLLAGQAGPGGIVFDDVPATYFVGTVAMAVILFDSGFQTSLAAWRVAAAPALALALVGVPVTALVVAAVARPLLGLGWPEALLMGAVVGSTDAAAVFFLLRVGGITLREKVRATLEVESGSNDPMAVLLTLGLVEYLRAGQALPAGLYLAHFAWQLAGGAAFGLVGGWLAVRLVNRLRLDPGLYPVAVLALALLVFAGANIAGASGFLAVYLAGLVAGNSRLQGGLSLRGFQSGLTWLAQITMFVTLGLLAKPARFGEVLTPALGLAAVLILVARPLAVALCLLPFRFPWRETGFIAWVGLRGAVSILFALVPMLAGVANGRLYFHVAFLVVVVSLVVQGWTVRPLARRLGLIVPRRQGPLERIELELPGEAACELVAYTLREGSPVARGHRLPRWARPALIVRDGRRLDVHTAGRLRAGDSVYLFATPPQLPLLDRLFAGTREIDPQDEALWGDFALAAEVPWGEVAEAYGLAAPGTDPTQSLGEMFRRAFRDDLEVGDRLSLGPVELIVREMKNGRVTLVGLALEPTPSRTGRVMGWLGLK